MSFLIGTGRTLRARMVPASLVLIIGGCVDAGMRQHEPQADVRYAPPPAEAPHGTRYRLTDGTQVIYQQPLAAYVVVGESHTYYHGGWFYAFRDDTWYVAPAADGPWKVLRGPIPPGLAGRHAR